MKKSRTLFEMRKLIAESKGNTEEVRQIRTDLTKVAANVASMGGVDKRFKKVEALLDKARKMLFDMQD